MLSNQKEKFSIPSDVSYLNCAYMSPMMDAVEEVGIQALRRKGRPYQIKAEDFFTPVSDLRTAFGRLVNCSPDQVVPIPSVSYGIANVLQNIRLTAGQRVVIAGEQFPSNTYPWFRAAQESGAIVDVIDPPDTYSRRGMKWNERLLEAIQDDVAVVAIAQTHWADGTKFDLVGLRARTREVGAALVVDGTQSVGALPFDVAKIEPDALICAGYKWLLGPYSIGLAYYDPSFNDGLPIEENWINRYDSQNFAGLVEYEDKYLPGAARYGVGEQSNFVLVPMLTRSIQQILEWGVEKIQAYCQDISQEFVAHAREQQYWVEDEDTRGYHLFGIKIPGAWDPAQVKSQLEADNVFVSIRGTSIRISPHVYNTHEDFEKLDRILKESLPSEVSL